MRVHLYNFRLRVKCNRKEDRGISIVRLLESERVPETTVVTRLEVRRWDLGAISILHYVYFLFEDPKNCVVLTLKEVCVIEVNMTGLLPSSFKPWSGNLVTKI